MRHLVRYIRVVLAFLCVALHVVAAEIPQLKKVTSTEGREFYVGFLLNASSKLTPTPDPTLKLTLIASSREAQTIVLEYANGASKEYKVAAGKSVLIDVDPQNAYVDLGAQETEKAVDKGLRVYSKEKRLFSLISYNKNGSDKTSDSQDAALIFPVEALGKEYVIQTSPVDNIATEFMIVGTEDDTEITISQTADSEAKKKGVTYDIRLMAKQVWLIRALPVEKDPTAMNLSGTTICASKPIAVFQGNQEAAIPKDGGAISKDHTYEQTLPINHWGKKYIVPVVIPLAEMALFRNDICVTAMLPNTQISVSGVTGVTGTTLQANETFELAISDYNCFTEAIYIEADKPIHVASYLPAGSENKKVKNGVRVSSGDESSMYVPAIEQLTDTLIFSTIDPDSDNPLEHYMVLWAKKDSVPLIKMNGASIASQFTTLPYNGGAYAFARITIDAEKTYTITSAGKDVTGCAYGVEDGQAYMMPIGFDFSPNPDSLFVEIVTAKGDSVLDVRHSELMKKTAPEVDRWYLDINLDLHGEPFMDSVFVCDSAELIFPTHITSQYDKVLWQIESAPDQPNTGRANPYYKEKEETTAQPLQHQFLLVPQHEEQLAPYEDFEVRLLVYPTPVICEELAPDTLKTLVRVLRAYNDTIWKTICVDDTIRFFYDDYNHPGVGKADSTTFVYNHTDQAKDILSFDLGVNSYSRSYISSGGCDSMMTLMLLVCDTSLQRVDTVVCQEKLKELRNGFPGRFQKVDFTKAPALKDTIYYDTAYVKCWDDPTSAQDPLYLQFKNHCKDFKGCESVLELHLKMMPVKVYTEQKPWCIASQEDVYMDWLHEDGSLIRKIPQDDPQFGTGIVGNFHDTIWHNPCTDCPDGKCPKIVHNLTLIKISSKPIVDTVHICQHTLFEYKDQFQVVRLRYDADTIPVGKEQIDSFQVIVKSGNVQCEYKQTLHLWVDTVYRDLAVLDTACCSLTDRYVWENHDIDEHKVWDVTGDSLVKASEISLAKPGVYTYIDSLKTLTCQACQNGPGCDSIWTLTLIVGDTFQIVDPLVICDNKYATWQDTVYYGFRCPLDSLPAEVPASRRIALPETTKWSSQKDTFSRYNCDSVRILDLTIHPTWLEANVTDTNICEGQVYEFYGKTYYFDYQESGEPYKLTDTISSTCGCDSGITHRVFVHKRYFLQDTDTAYQEIDVKYSGWNSHLFTEDPTRTIWMVDSVRNTKWALHPDSIPLSVPGTFYLWDSLKTKTCQTCFDGPGCDSIFVRQLTILPTYAYEHHRDLSSEETFVWEGKLYAGEYATIPADWTGAVLRLTADTCDTVQYYTTQAIAPFPPSVGTYDKGDSLEILCIRLGKVFRDTLYDATCRNCDYDWTIHPFGVAENDDSKDTLIHISSSLYPLNSDTLFYDDSLRTMMGFDSIYTLVLSIYPNKLYQDADAMECQGNEFNWHTHPGQRDYLYITRDGQTTAIYKDDFASVITQDSGWVVITDSLLTDSLYVNTQTHESKHIQCDSIWQLNLYVSPTYSEKYNPNDVHFQTTICSNDTVLWNNYLYVGYDFDTVAHPLSKVGHDSIIYVPKDSVASYYDSVPTLGTKNGCDSTNYLRITINPSRFTLLIDSIGDNDETWSFGGKGGTFSYKGKPYITRNDLINSDTIHYDSDKRVVQQFFFIDTLKTSNGCDTIVHDSLWILPSYRYDFDTTVCRNALWSWRPESPNWQRFKDINYQCSGQCTFYDSLLTKPVGSRQLDSVYVLHLTVLPASETWFYPNMCKNDTIEWETLRIHFNQESQSMSPVYKANYANGAGCDSTLLLQPTYYEFYHFDDVAKEDSTCQYVPYHWIEEDGTEHLHALRGEKGEIFDSIPTDSLPSPEGGWITIYDSLHTSSICHCDSTYTLRLYIRPTKFHHLSYTACTSDTVYWIDRISQCVFDTTGYGFDADVDRKYYCDSACKVLDTIAGVTSCGCDSSYYLTIQFNQSYYFHKEDTVCSTHGEYVWNGITIPQEVFDRVHNTTLDLDTVVWDSLQTLQTSCDSLYVLSLKIKPSLTEYITDTICSGERYILNGDTFAIDTVIHQTLTNQFGCDSFLVATLQVVPPTDFKISPVIECADANSYTLHYEFDTLHGYAPHTIRIVYDSLALAYDFPKDTVEIETVGNEVEVDLPDATPYLTPNVYSATIFFDNGVCIEPESQRKDFLITIQYPSWVLEQHWSDAICILNKDYNGGYEFNQYQWYKNGDLIPGETKPYLFVPQYLDLDAEYQVLLTRSDDSISVLTCPAELTLRDSSLMPTKPYVSVVPTLIPKAFPYTNILCNEPGAYTIYSPYGVAIQSGRFEPGDHNAYQVKIPAEQGIYLFDLRQENNGEQRSIKVVVQ